MASERPIALNDNVNGLCFLPFFSHALKKDCVVSSRPDWVSAQGRVGSCLRQQIGRSGKIMAIAEWFWISPCMGSVLVRVIRGGTPWYSAASVQCRICTAGISPGIQVNSPLSNIALISAAYHRKRWYQCRNSLQLLYTHHCLTWILPIVRL